MCFSRPGRDSNIYFLNSSIFPLLDLKTQLINGSYTFHKAILKCHKLWSDCFRQLSEQDLALLRHILCWIEYNWFYVFAGMSRKYMVTNWKLVAAQKRLLWNMQYGCIISGTIILLLHAIYNHIVAKLHMGNTR